MLLCIPFMVGLFTMSACSSSSGKSGGGDSSLTKASVNELKKGLAGNLIPFKAPNLKGAISLEETIAKRRSVRSYENKKLTDEQISQLFWSAQGITGKSGFLRASPSAGATFPIELFLVTADGLFVYFPEKHALGKIHSKDLREPLFKTSTYSQNFIKEAGALFIVTADFKRTSKRYGNRAIQYVHFEVGHIGQNISLQAISLGLSSVMVGAFDDTAVRKTLNLPGDLNPLYIIPVGYQK